MNDNKSQKSIPRQILRGSVITFASLITIFIMLVFVIPTVLSIIAGKGESLVDDSNMQLKTINLAEEDNMFYDLEKIADIIDTNLIDKNFEEILADKYWDEEIISQVLSKNKEALELRDQALKKKSYQSPISADPEKISLEHHNTTNHYRKLIKLSIVKALWLAKKGQTELAYEEILKNMIIADAIEKSQNDFILFLVAIGNKNISLDAFEIVEKSDTNNQFTGKYKKELSNYKVGKNESFFKNEYLIRKKYTFAISEGRYSDALSEGGYSYLNQRFIKNDFYFDPAMNINRDYQLFSEIIKNYHGDCQNESSEKIYKAEDIGSPLNIVRLYFTKNAVGKVLYTFPEISYRSIIEKKCKLNERINNLTQE
jgi:hypothetical protein